QDSVLCRPRRSANFRQTRRPSGVVNGAAPSGVVQTILSWVVPVVIFYLVWMFLFRRLADKQGFGGLMTVGKSRAKVYVETDTKVTFKDVSGVDEAKFE